MKAVPIALAAALLLPGAPAGAQTASDVRCLILSNVFAQKAAEPDVQKVAQASFYFYLGRVADRVTAPQLKALFDDQSKTINDDSAGAMMKNCVQKLKSRASQCHSLSQPQA